MIVNKMVVGLFYSNIKIILVFYYCKNKKNIHCGISVLQLKHLPNAVSSFGHSFLIKISLLVILNIVWRLKLEVLLVSFLIYKYAESIYQQSSVQQW